MSSLWLNKKRKNELVALCEHLDLETEGFRKTDLETILSEYLEAHENELASDSTFSPYYDSFNSRSPMKTTIAVEGTEKRTRRRTSRFGSSIDQASTYSAEDTTPEPAITERKTRSNSRPVATRTPRTVRSIRQAAGVPLPPSPAAVANEIEARANAIVASAKQKFENAEIQERATGVRDALSNVVSVNAVALTLELAYLFSTLIPRTYEVTVPAVSALGTQPQIFVLPDLFVLLSAAFWAPFLTWVATSIAGPLANSLLFNLVATSVKLDSLSDTTGYKADPLTFAVTKTLIAWLVHYKQFNFWGLLGSGAVDTVATSVGKELQLVTAGVGGIAALWEAILKR